MEETKRIVKISEELSVVLKTQFFEDDIDMDRITRVDVMNIHAEVVTMPVILNKAGILLADVTEKFNLAKLDVDITESQLKEKYYNDAATSGDRLSEDKCNVKVRNNVNWKVKKKQFISRQKDMEYVNSLYWALKTKNDKVDLLARSINTEDIIEFLKRTKLKQFNHVNLKLVKPLADDED